MTLREVPASEDFDLRATSISNAQQPVQQRLGIVAHGCCRGVIRALMSVDSSLRGYQVMTSSQGGRMHDRPGC